ncbi:protein FAM180A [Sphaeramia orbicularis]|uniref:protein FAM180A n=1 Tax=Sphaeramia orbicularis TaxID=375764 RepID=UPI00117F27FD|nr:protein FAM180A-like [Sphaeramia orbicularis]
MKLHLKICLQVMVWLCFDQVLYDVAAGRSTTPQKAGLSLSHANLMFEFLLGGVEIDQDNNIILLDEELASMRAGRSFLSQINDDIPRSRSAMAQMMTELQSQRRKSLTQAEFDSVLLSMVYSAHQAWHQEGEEERQAWGGLLLQLANVTLHELRGQYFISYA